MTACDPKQPVIAITYFKVRSVVGVIYVEGDSCEIPYPLFLIIAFWSTDCAAQTEADKDEILQTFDSWSRGWAAADADLAVQDYAEDSDWTNAFGDRFQGKDSLRKGLEYIFSLGFVMAGDSAGNEYNDVIFLSPDVATVRSKLVRSGQQTSTGEVMPDRHINHLRVYQKRDGRWLIVSHLISQAKEKG